MNRKVLKTMKGKLMDSLTMLWTCFCSACGAGTVALVYLHSLLSKKADGNKIDELQKHINRVSETFANKQDLKDLQKYVNEKSSDFACKEDLKEFKEDILRTVEDKFTSIINMLQLILDSDNFKHTQNTKRRR